MSQRQRAGRRPLTGRERDEFLASLATETGQPVDQVAQHIRRAVELGWLIETTDGWQAALPTDVAPADWTGPST
jgi:hypothetical protein